MRRPLTPNGVPLVQPPGAASDILFDTTALDPAYTYAVTVFCWYPKGLANNVAIGVATDGGVVVPTALFLSGGAPIDAFRANGIGPAKVMDRVVLRGNQQVHAFSADADLISPVVWWGYVERAGVAPVAMEYRPLQPSNDLVEPYSAPPALIFIPAGGGPVTQTIHALDDSGEQRMDFLSLYLAAITSTAPLGTAACVLHAPGGADIDIPVLVGDAGGAAGSPGHLYDNIPVRAPAAGDNLYQLEVTGDAGVDTTVVAYGRFARA